jgi:hypothetical protein
MESAPVTAPAAECTDMLHKFKRGSCPCGRVTRVRAVRPWRLPPRQSPADWLLRTLNDGLVAAHFRGREQPPDPDAEHLATALRALVATVEAVTYEATVNGHWTRRPYHDLHAAAVLDALVDAFRDWPGFREEWTA